MSACEHGFDPAECVRCAQENHDNHALELQMPFVTVKSVGGPHDDESYVQGWAMCCLDVALGAEPDNHAVAVHPSSIPQADLIGMKHGYQMTSEPWEQHPDEWALLTFTRSAGTAPTNQTCSFCGEQRDDLSTSGDVAVCQDCAGDAEAQS